MENTEQPVSEVQTTVSVSPATNNAPQISQTPPQKNASSGTGVVLALLLGVACFIAGLWLGPMLLKTEDVQGDPPGIITENPPLLVDPTPIHGAGWATYTDNKIGFSIEYPQDWKVEPTYIRPKDYPYPYGVNIYDETATSAVQVEFYVDGTNEKTACEDPLKSAQTKEGVVEFCRRSDHAGGYVWTLEKPIALTKEQINKLDPAWKESFAKMVTTQEHIAVYVLKYQSSPKVKPKNEVEENEFFAAQEKIALDIISTFHFIR